MKIYVIKFADGSEQDVMRPYHDTKESATQELMNCVKETGCSPFDFKLEKKTCDVNEIVTTFEEARSRLGIKPNTDFYVGGGRDSNIILPLVDIQKFVRDINPKHLGALIALNELFTIAEAWNKEDGFVPDFSDLEQDKWYPWFKYDNDATGFVYAGTAYTPTTAYAPFGARLCFKSSERAAQFGKQFADLYNSAFLP